MECLSLLTGIREFHVYLAAAPFVVYTDHISVKYLESLKVSAHNRLARWALALQPYKFTVEHVAGTKLTAAGGLSRRPFDPPIDLEVDDELQEDSFIAQIDRDVFRPSPGDKSRPAPRKDKHFVSPVSDKDEANVSGKLLDYSAAVPSQSVAGNDAKSTIID